MTPSSLPPDRFEERLLNELKQVVADQPAPAIPIKIRRKGFALSPRGYRLAGAGGGLALAAAGIVLVTGGDSSTPAYAVQTTPDGKVAVEIKSFKDADGLEKKLTAAGVPAVVNYLPLGKACAAGRFTTAQATGPGTSQIKGSGEAGKPGSVTFTIDRSEVPKGATLVVQTSGGDPDSVAPGGAGPQTARASGLRLAYAKGGVGKCVPVDAPVPSGPTKTKQGSGGAPFVGSTRRAGKGSGDGELVHRTN
jgi:hypothetical protein